MLLNGGDNLVVFRMEKAEVLNTFLPQSSQAKITPRFPGVPAWFGKEQVREQQVRNELEQPDVFRSMRTDEINLKVLKELADTTPRVLPVISKKSMIIGAGP